MATTALSRREGLVQWWQLRSRAERTLLVLVATVLALTLGWLLIGQPLLQDTEQLTRQLATDRVTLTEAQRQADAIAGLAGGVGGISADRFRSLIEGESLDGRVGSYKFYFRIARQTLDLGAREAGG